MTLSPPPDSPPIDTSSSSAGSTGSTNSTSSTPSTGTRSESTVDATISPMDADMHTPNAAVAYEGMDVDPGLSASDKQQGSESVDDSCGDVGSGVSGMHEHEHADDPPSPILGHGDVLAPPFASVPSATPTPCLGAPATTSLPVPTILTPIATPGLAQAQATAAGSSGANNTTLPSTLSATLLSAGHVLGLPSSDFGHISEAVLHAALRRHLATGITGLSTLPQAHNTATSDADDLNPHNNLPNSHPLSSVHPRWATDNSAPTPFVSATNLQHMSSSTSTSGLANSSLEVVRRDPIFNLSDRSGRGYALPGSALASATEAVSALALVPTPTQPPDLAKRDERRKREKGKGNERKGKHSHGRSHKSKIGHESKSKSGHKSKRDRSHGQRPERERGTKREPLFTRGPTTSPSSVALSLEICAKPEPGLDAEPSYPHDAPSLGRERSGSATVDESDDDVVCTGSIPAPPHSIALVINSHGSGSGSGTSKGLKRPHEGGSGQSKRQRVRGDVGAINRWPGEHGEHGDDGRGGDRKPILELGQAAAAADMSDSEPPLREMTPSSRSPSPLGCPTCGHVRSSHRDDHDHGHRHVQHHEHRRDSPSHSESDSDSDEEIRPQVRRKGKGRGSKVLPPRVRAAILDLIVGRRPGHSNAPEEHIRKVTGLSGWEAITRAVGARPQDAERVRQCARGFMRQLPGMVERGEV